MRVLVLGCSAVTTGELTMAMELLSRCSRPMDLHMLVGTSLVGMGKWWKARVHTYPSLGVSSALQKIEQTVRGLRPDVVIVADILLMYGLSPEFSGQLSGMIPEALQLAKVAALDLYDFNRSAMDVDIFGRRLFTAPPRVPEQVGRLFPCPSLPPAPNAPGRGHYQTVDDVGRLPLSVRNQTRRELGIAEGHAMVVITTSAWQHRLNTHAEGSRVARHFPNLMFDFMEQAALKTRPITVVHVGSEGFGDAQIRPHVSYQHLASMPPEQFKKVLGSADVHLSNNCPSTTAMRAAAMRVPVLTWFAGAGAPKGNTPGLQRYLDETKGGYPFYLWPVGMYGMVKQVMTDNPFAQTQQHADVHDGDAAVEALVTLLSDVSQADALRHAQEQYFADLQGRVGTPDEALKAALFEA